MTSSVGSLGRLQYLREFEDNLNKTDNFQEVGGKVGEALGDCERELMEAYSSLETIKAPTAAETKNLSADEVKAKEKAYEQDLRNAENKIQKLNIRYKRLQNIMELFQTIVKNHYETVQRMIQNLSLR